MRSIRVWQVSHCQAAWLAWPLEIRSIMVWPVSHCQAACKPCRGWVQSELGRCHINQGACRPWPLEIGSIRAFQVSHCQAAWLAWPLEIRSIMVWPVSHCQAACRPCRGWVQSELGRCDITKQPTDLDPWRTSALSSFCSLFWKGHLNPSNLWTLKTFGSLSNYW